MNSKDSIPTELHELLVKPLKRAYFNGHTDNDARKNGVIPPDTKLGEYQISVLSEEAIDALSALISSAIPEKTDGKELNRTVSATSILTNDYKAVKIAQGEGWDQAIESIKANLRDKGIRI